MKEKFLTQLKINQLVTTLILFFAIAFQGFAQNVTYSESDDDFMNPDRGFYYPYDSEGWVAPNDAYNALDQDLLDQRRTGTPFQPDAQWDSQGTIDAAYSVNNSVILRHWVLDDFKTNPNDTATIKSISPAFISKIRNDLDVARNAGVRVIVRFSYILQPNSGNCAHGICPPYGDSNESTIIRHIENLEETLKDYEDVIMLVQQGFIGIWGEQYYSDYFGDASGQTNGQPAYLTGKNWSARFRVLKKLLDAVPDSRMVQVRYPQMRQLFLQRHSEYANRIGFQNDCFLSSADDVGTYSDYNSNPTLTKEELREYADNTGDFVAVGGETCGGSQSDAASYAENDCIVNGGAVKEMEQMNYSFLNSAYSYVVNNDWADGGCIYEVKTRLGYRFVLNNGQFQDAAQKGDVVNFSLNLENKGFAAPFNERKLFMLLKNNSTNNYLAPIEVYGDKADVRTWRSGSHNLSLRFTMPTNISVGDYSMYLHIADLSKQNQSIESVRNNPAYCIRLANTNMWDANTGYNNLNHTISIQNTPPQPEPPVSSNCIGIDGNFADWQGIVEASSANNAELSVMKVADDSNKIYIYLSGTLKDHYQIFLDTDGNAQKVNNNDNEYLSSNWPQTGFNYMLENGTIFKYVSANSWDWVWTEIGQLQAFENNGLELLVSKNLLGSLSNSNINIAVNTFRCKLEWKRLFTNWKPWCSVSTIFI